MSARTGKAIAIDALQRALGWPASVLDTDTTLRDFVLSRLNARGDMVWNMRTWDNEKIDSFTITPAAVTGIITFPLTVDIVRALRKINDTQVPDTYPEGYPIFSQDETISALTPDQLAMNYYEVIADDSTTGARRARINLSTTDATQVYRVWAVSRFVQFTVLNWTTVTFPIDRATTALVGFLADDIRDWQNLPPTKDGDAAMAVALDRDKYQQNRDIRGVPRYPMFAEAGRW